MAGFAETLQLAKDLSSPLTSALVIVTAITSFVMLVFVTRAHRRAMSVAARLDDLERRTLGYRTYERYLRNKDRTPWLARVSSLSRDIDWLESNRWLVGSDRSKLVGFRRRTDSLKAFLESFLPELARKEIERHQSFFQRAGLDKDQAVAVVMNDSANLVVAAAGSGKTRTLTSRIAYLAERGVPQERILALAYTNGAADEMNDRLAKIHGMRGVDIRTLHGFCRDLARRSPGFRSDVADQSEQSKIIREAAEALSAKDRGFAVKLLSFAVDLDRAEAKEPHDFPSARQYYDYLREEEYETINMVRVKSIAEREIGNFLFLNGVDFTYEAKARWADRNSSYRDYHPDFHLPNYNLWIEHWAVDRQGNVPEWFFSTASSDPSERYRLGMDYKREQFRRRNQKLLETFHYQWSEGTLIPELKRQLEENGVALKEIPMPEILDRIDNLIRRDPLYELMFSFIRKAKTNGLNPKVLVSRFSEGGESWTPRQKSFASLMVPIWQEYESQLAENNMLDFSDMINLALEVARRDRDGLAREHAHVLVDEFQDITDPQLELIQCLLGNTDDNSLYCVGDHRQNIFSFAGSNVYNIIDFEKRFQYPEKTSLPTNYRCPRNIVEASNTLIAAGAYSDRPAVASSAEDHPILLIEKTSNERYEDWELESSKELLIELLTKRKSGEEILVLARYNFRLEQLKVAFPGHEKLRLSFKSIHSAKGTEADYVLVLGCVSGEFGFPSKVLEENLLEIVSARKQDAKEKLEEERRLFYVALTRCRKQLFLFTSAEDRSQFLTEIAKFVELDRLSKEARSGKEAGVDPASPTQTGAAMNLARSCPQCGKAVAPADRFCTRCGNAIPALKRKS